MAKRGQRTTSEKIQNYSARKAGELVGTRIPGETAPTVFPKSGTPRVKPDPNATTRAGGKKPYIRG